MIGIIIVWLYTNLSMIVLKISDGTYIVLTWFKFEYKHWMPQKKHLNYMELVISNQNKFL